VCRSTLFKILILGKTSFSPESPDPGDWVRLPSRADTAQGVRAAGLQFGAVARTVDQQVPVARVGAAFAMAEGLGANLRRTIDAVGKQEVCGSLDKPHGGRLRQYSMARRFANSPG
jgi:hypothetical protein